MTGTFETELAPAKLNIVLHVREKRADGYHALESLFAFARDGDLVQGRARSDGELRLSIDGPFSAGLGDGADNLVISAARALRDAAARDGNGGRGADIRLVKNLPIASGIGGGSADAAATLRLLNRVWKLDWPTEALLPIAAELGSDVPACLVGKPMLVSGRGEVLETVDMAELSELHLLMVNALQPVSTAQVFARWDGKDRGALGNPGLADLLGGRNDLEAAAIAVSPVIRTVLDDLAAAGGRPLCTRMSGSGGTCFALYDDPAARREAADHLRASHPEWWIMESGLQ